MNFWELVLERHDRGSFGPMVAAFWLQTKEPWPRRTYDHTFLADALDEIGRAMYGASWQGAGREYLQGRWFREGERRRQTATNSRGPTQILQPLETVRRVSMAPKTTEQPTARPTADPAALAKAIAALKEFEESAQTSAERWAAVQGRAITEAADGLLQTALRAPAGGGIGAPLPATLWHSEQLDPRFVLCQMSPNEPFSSAHAGTGFYKIFVTNKSLGDLLRRIEQRSSAAGSAMNRFERGLADLIAKFPSGSPTTRANLLTAAQERFPGLTEYAFDTVWRSAVAGNPAWTRPGPKKKVSPPPGGWF